MATRSTIAVVNEDNTVTQIYCHWDGYLEHNGRILTESYNSLELAKQLVSFGDLSVLAAQVEPETDTHSFDSPTAGICVYYGRDRGETGTEARTFATVEDYMENASMEDYNYLFVDGEWFYDDESNEELSKVTDALNLVEA